MNHDSEYTPWPSEAGDPASYPQELQPPAGLEDRVVGALLQRELIHADPPPVGRHFAWRVMRAALAISACVALVAVGALIGRLTMHAPPPLTTALTGAETDLYALLLYETDGYEKPTGPEAMARYGEYSVWVADARRRGQFVTGEDLEVERGWMLIPSAGGAQVEAATSVAAAPLSGIFFIRAKDADHALQLARELPHLRHGGRVLVQKTIPTDVRPPATE